MTLPFIPIVQEEPVREYVQPDGSVYLRSGHCCHCGACCSDGDPFAEVQTDPVSPCSKLIADEAGVLQCTGRDTAYYNNGCNVWPTAPSHVATFPACTYRFDLVSNGG